MTNNILVLTYWSYSDALIQTYTLPYVRIIRKQVSEDSKIYLVTLDKDGTNGVQDLHGSGIQNISFIYKGYGISALFAWIKNIWVLKRLIHKNQIDTIHAYCTLAGMFGYILSLLCGKKLIIDSYEPHAEAMVENGTWSRRGLSFLILWFFEKRQSQRASLVIAATASMRQYAHEKYHAEFRRFYVKPACVDLELFTLEKSKKPELLKALQLEDKLVCLYAGKFGGIYLKEEVFDFFQSAYAFWKDELRIMLLTAHSENEVLSMASKFNLPANIFVIKFVTHNLIADYMGLADFAITPVKSLPSKRYCTPIKDGEYWAMGLPVIITSGISDDSEIIENNQIGYVWKNTCREEYEKSIHVIHTLLSDNREVLSKRIREFAIENRNFSIAESIYKEIYGPDAAPLT